MSRKRIPSRPVEAYKRLIDDLVEQTPSISARLISKNGIYSKGNSDFAKEMNSFVHSLSRKQRNSLARMLTDSRSGGIAEVLAELSWWIACHGLALTYRGEPMPVELSGMGLHGDYIGRLDGWKWPAERPEE